MMTNRIHVNEDFYAYLYNGSRIYSEKWDL